jgi:hypothetical protein
MRNVSLISGRKRGDGQEWVTISRGAIRLAEFENTGAEYQP